MLTSVEDPAVLKTVKQFVCLQYGRQGGDFPAPTPSSLMLVDQSKLSSEPYWVCEKTDGTRMLFCCLQHHATPMCLMVNRSFRVFQIQSKWHVSAFQNGGTLLDGELDNEGTFQIFDAVLLSGKSYLKCASYKERLEAARTFISRKFRTMDKCVNMAVKRPVQTCHLSDLIKTIDWAHADGLVFTPENTEIKTNTQDDMFKWKWPEKHTVDLWIRAAPAKSPDEGLYKYDVEDPDPRFCYLHCVANQYGGTPLYCGKVLREAQWTETDGQIVECSFVIQDSQLLDVQSEWEQLRQFRNPRQPNHFRIVQFRKDKSLPNSIRTVCRTMKNRLENITLPQLESWFAQTKPFL